MQNIKIEVELEYGVVKRIDPILRYVFVEHI